MDFGWDPADRELYQQIVRFSRRLGEQAGEAAAPGLPPGSAAWRRCGELGLLGLCIPQQYGGSELGALSTAHAIEAFGYGCPDMGLVFAASAHLLACAKPIALHGSEELRRRVLPRLCSGEQIGSNAITEPEAGSDVFALKSRAVREGDSYVLSGSKLYVTNGPVADVFLVYASTQPAHGYMGISAFLVERGAEGLRIGAPSEKSGLAGAPLGSLYLEGCRVPLEHRIGEEQAGARIFAESMRWERSCLFAAYLGSMQRQLETVIQHASTRRQFNRPIGKNQAVSHRIADMKLRLESARWLLYHACWLLDRGAPAELETSLAKLAVSEAAIQSGLDAIQIHGGMGVASESGIGQALLDALPSAIFSGTSEMQREIIARKLGL
jgi:alkylation response protein AidB-like acyl-CoA dehydrogenase